MERQNTAKRSLGKTLGIAGVLALGGIAGCDGEEYSGVVTHGGSPKEYVFYDAKAVMRWEGDKKFRKLIVTDNNEGRNVKLIAKDWAPFTFGFDTVKYRNMPKEGHAFYSFSDRKLEEFWSEVVPRSAR